VAATPVISPAAGTYASAQTATISDATAGVAILLHHGRVHADHRIEHLLRLARDPIFRNSSSYRDRQRLFRQRRGHSSLHHPDPSNRLPCLSSMSPAYTFASGAAFTLTVAGSAFTAQSTIFWGTSALATQYVSATQLSARSQRQTSLLRERPPFPSKPRRQVAGHPLHCSLTWVRRDKPRQYLLPSQYL